MDEPDLNLLTALDALLTEGGVTGAARRLGLSPSAMSRTLARLRTATGDRLLVRAGRDMVPTPHAVELRERVQGLAHDARAVLRPAEAAIDIARLNRSFTIRSNDGFAEIHAPRIIAAAAAVAPEVRLRFTPKPFKDAQSLRAGLIDLDIGVLGESGPEIRLQALFRDHFIAVVRSGHELLGVDRITPERFAAAGHVVVARRDPITGPLDEALSALGLTRKIVAVVPSFRAAIAVTGESDLVALVTHSFFEGTQNRGAHPSAAGVRSLALPVQTEGITVSQMWHPRVDSDPAHRWLRTLVLDTCRGT